MKTTFLKFRTEFMLSTRLTIVVFLLIISNSVNAIECQYGDNTSSGITYTLVANSTAQTMSTTFASNKYFILNVVKGLSYQIYTTSAPSSALKIAIYEEGNPASALLASSTTNTGNPGSANANNVYVSFTSPLSGQLRVLINTQADCASTAVTGLTVKAVVSGGSNTQDDSNAVATDSWIGHIYNGNNLNTYLGYYTEAETFDQAFVANNDASFFNIYSASQVRAKMKNTNYSIRYRMNSTKRGLYVVNLGSDDGTRLTVDGTLVYNNWSTQPFSTRSRILMTLTGTSSLVYDFFENTGGNRVVFNSLTLVLGNTLTTNTSQSLCIGGVSTTISGDTYGALPAGISLSGTGYQWSYSTTPEGSRTNIVGATAATFTPNTSVAPFNQEGTYYVYRNAKLISTNNTNNSGYIATNESNAAIIEIKPYSEISISSSANPVCEGQEVTLTASTTNAGSSPSFQWKVNGIAVGANSTTYTYTPLAADAVSCEMTTDATACSLANPTISNTINLAFINPTEPITVAIDPSSNPTCLQRDVRFTATVTNGNADSYQWKVNGVNVGTSTASYTYQPTDQDVVTCTITSTAPCTLGSPATSNGVTMTVHPEVVNMSLTSAPETVVQETCYNSPIIPITYSTVGATGASFIGLPDGITGTWNANAVSISGTSTASGTFSYTVTTTGGLCDASAGGTLTIRSEIAAPATTGATLIIGGACTLSASGAISGQKYKWYNASSGGSLLKTSNNNTDNTYTTPILSASTTYWVSIQNEYGCESARTQVIAAYPSVSTDDQTLAGADSWIGHVYDETNLNTYFGTRTESETFNESFGGSSANYTINSSLGTRQIYTETYSVRYRMNSTRKGLYVVGLGSDDGSRLSVDGTMVYNNWVNQGFTNKTNVLMNLTGSSALIYDFYENGGGNQVVFINLTQVIANTLSVNNTQNLTLGNTGTEISGDVFGALPTGISLSGTGYQWTYSTTAMGVRTDIPGATSATFIPNTNVAPFNAVGTIYLYRKAILSSANNVSPTTYIATNESNAAIISISPIINYWTGAVDNDWSNPANWYTGVVPASGANIEFSTIANVGVDASNSLILNGDYSFESLTNMTSKQIIIPAGKSVNVTGTITTDGNPNRILLRSNAIDGNASLIFHNDVSNPVQATVEMYSKASAVTYNPTTKKYSNYKWQFFGIPLRTVIANPTFNGSYIRQYFENVVGTSGYWVQLNNSSTLSAFKGYEITQAAFKTITFQGELENRDYNSGQLSYTTTATYKGEHLIGNSYTSAIDISKIEFGSTDAAIIENTIYLYNTGSYTEWTNTGSGTSSGTAPGQYLAVPQMAAGTFGLPSQIPSMQAFTVYVKSDNPLATISIPYSAAGTTKNTDLQRAPAQQKICTRVDVLSNGYTDNLWLFTDETCSNSFDNGWDGIKTLSSGSNSQIYAIEDSKKYQVNGVADVDNTQIGFIAGTDSIYTFRFNQQAIENRYGKLYLADNYEGTTTDITLDGSEYTFKVSPLSVTEDRFKITTNIGITTGNAKNATAKIKIYEKNGKVFVENQDKSSGEITIVDMLGHSLYKTLLQPFSTVETNCVLPNGWYIVNAFNAKENTSKKILLRK